MKLYKKEADVWYYLGKYDAAYGKPFREVPDCPRSVRTQEERQAAYSDGFADEVLRESLVL